MPPEWTPEAIRIFTEAGKVVDLIDAHDTLMAYVDKRDILLADVAENWSKYKEILGFVGKLGETTGSVVEYLDHLDAKVKEMDKIVGENTEKIKSAVEYLVYTDAKVKEIDRKVGENAGKIKIADAKINEIDKKVGENVEKIKSHTDRINQAFSKLTTHTKDISNIVGGLRTHSSQISDNRRLIDSHTRKLNEWIPYFDKKVDTYKKDISGLKDTTTKISTAVTNHWNTHTSNIKYVKERLEKLINTMEKDPGGNTFANAWHYRDLYVNKGARADAGTCMGIIIKLLERIRDALKDIKNNIK